MDRSKRNSIAGFPPRVERLEEFEGGGGGDGNTVQVGRVSSSSYRAIISAFSRLTSLDDFTREKNRIWVLLRGFQGSAQSFRAGDGSQDEHAEQ